VTKRKTKTQQLQAAGQITGFEYVFKQKINILLQSFELIEKLPSETVEQIKEKDKIYGEFRNLVRRFQEVADAWTSVYFGNEVPYENYDRLQEKLSASEEEWKNLRNEPWVKEALDIAKNKNFFHWELELPEIFFEGHQWKNNPGFDVVIGNPPYGTIIDKREVAFVREMFLSFEGNLENYGLFIERSIGFSLEGGRIGLIVPVTWCQIPQFSKLRSIVLTWSLDKLIELPTKVFGDSDLDTTVFILQKRRSSDDTETNVLSCQGSAAADADLHKKGQRVLKRDWLSAGGKLSFTHNTDVLGLLSKIQDISEPLGHLFDYSQGLVPYAREEMYRTMTKAEADRIVDEHDWHSNHRRDADFKRELRGDDIDRYIVNWNGKQWIKYGSWLARPREPRFFNEPRILIQEITRGTSLRAAFTAEEFYNNPGIINVVAKKTSNKDVEKPSLLFVLSLVNSSLFFSWHLCNSPKAKLVTSIPKILVEDVECFPIRRITFATSERDRKKQLEKGKTLYESCVKKGDDKRVTEFVEHHLSTKPERSDVVHDLLAFFAEQMIEMNKKKQKETKGFLSWLEGYSGAKIDDLTNKTKIKNYYELSWEDLLEVLEQNQRRIDKADISRRNPQEKIKKEFEDSLSKLNPLLSQIRTTDDLIDQIVYKLYGLTEKEINIVREQIKRV
jgi:hypothetical protein